jgi:hypothetical protein
VFGYIRAMTAIMRSKKNQSVTKRLQLVCSTTAILLLALAASGSETVPPASDPPGAPVRLQRNAAATTLPGDFTIFRNGNLQLYLGDRDVPLKTVAPAELSTLPATVTAPALDKLVDIYPAALPASAGDTLTLYGTHPRTIRYHPSSPDLPPSLQNMTPEVMKLRRRF